MLDNLLNSAAMLAQIASQIQNNDDIGIEERLALVQKLVNAYREWYTDCLATLPDSLQDAFQAEYNGTPTKRKIRDYLENPLEINPYYMVGLESSIFSKWLNPYSKTFHTPLEQQKTILTIGIKRYGLVVSRSYGGKVYDEPSYDDIYRNDLFVIMPYIEKLEEVYADHIVKVARNLGLTFARARDFRTIGSISQEVWNAIHGAHLVVADCTYRNPNVYYELGIAHSIRKPTIMISQNKEDIPTNVMHLRTIFYEFTHRGMERFETELEQTILRIRSE